MCVSHRHSEHVHASRLAKSFAFLIPLLQPFLRDEIVEGMHTPLHRCVCSCCCAISRSCAVCCTVHLRDVHVPCTCPSDTQHTRTIAQTATVTRRIQTSDRSTVRRVEDTWDVADEGMRRLVPVIYVLYCMCHVSCTHASSYQ